MITLDPDLLKTFLAFVDGGSLAKAASAVSRSPSAITAQMQRLEEIVGEPLLAAQGRGRGLTPAGEDLVGHARRILAVHTEAWLALKGARAGGRVAIAAGSAGLAGLRTAVNAGIALTLRTHRFAHCGIVEAPRELGLPPMPVASFAIRLSREAGRPARDLAELLGSGLALPS